MGKLFITGGDGFVGRALCARASQDGREVRCGLFEPLARVETVDPAAARMLRGIPATVVGGIGPDTDWTEALNGVETVVHLAARAHVLAETETNPLEAFREVNTHGAIALARACISNGVRRLVFVSSIGVHGSLNADVPFTEASALRPDKPYAVSKLEAEEGLREIAADTALEIVILRPPLVYGPHVRGNFLRLLDWTWKRVPLPLGAVHNTRTFIGLDNLVDVLLRCVDAPEAVGQTFVVGDDETISTAQLLRDIAHHFARPHRLFPCPPALLRSAAGLLGRAEDAERLLGDLAVDTTHVRKTLDWKPPVPLQEGLAGMCRWYRTRQEGAG